MRVRDYLIVSLPLIVVVATAQVFPFIQARKALVVTAPDTNRYHLTFAWDSVSNAQWYAVIVRSNGVEVQRRYSMTNSVTVSNLIGNTDVYQFTAIATNAIGESDESIPAPLHLSVIQVSDDLSNWLNAPTVIFDPTTNARNFLRLTNFDAQRALQKD